MKPYALLILFALSSSSLIAQNEKIFLKYDSAKKTFNIQKCTDDTGTTCTDFNREIKRGKTYDVYISGINTATIKTKIKLKPFVISSSTPDIIKPFFPGIFNSSQVNIDSTPTLKTKINALNSESESAQPKTQLEKLYISAVNSYNRLTVLRKSANMLYKSTSTSTNTCMAKKVYKSILDEFDNDISSDDILVININEPSNCSFDIDKERLQALNLKVNSYTDYISTVTETHKLNLEKLEDLPPTFMESYVNLIQMQKAVSNQNFTAYSNFIWASTKASAKSKPSTFTANKDGIDLNVALIDTYVKDTLLTKTIDFYSKGNFSFDFSSGFFYTNKVEQSYYLEARDTLKNNILKESVRDFDVSFGALGHFSYQFSSDVKAGINMGASISPLDGKTRYLVGTSLIFGKKNQLALNVGVSFVKLKVLSGATSKDDVGPYVEAAVTSVPTYEKVKSGLFFGITYNLTGKKKYD